MNAEKRGIITFVGLGLLSAVGVGVGVWHASSPTPASVESRSVVTSTTDAPVSTTSESHSEKPTEKKSEKKEPDAPSEATAAAGHGDTTDQAAGIENDPFLAPNARINTEKRDAEPTHYYRPGNISAGQDSSDGAGQGNSDRGAGNQAGQPGAQNQQQPGGEAPQQPAQPGNGGNERADQPGNPPAPETSNRPDRPDQPTSQPSTEENPGSDGSDSAPAPQKPGEEATGGRETEPNAGSPDDGDAIMAPQELRDRVRSAAERATGGDAASEPSNPGPSDTEPTDAEPTDATPNEAGLPTGGDRSANSTDFLRR